MWCSLVQEQEDDGPMEKKEDPKVEKASQKHGKSKTKQKKAPQLKQVKKNVNDLDIRL